MKIRSSVSRWFPPSCEVPIRYFLSKLRNAGHLMHDLDAIMPFIRPGSCAIDVGANFGLFTYAFSRRAGVVHAFEPLSECADVLSAFAKRVRNVHVHPVALSDHIGESIIRVPYRDDIRLTGWATLNACNEPHTEHVVNLLTLDSLALKNVSVIKIDVEGYEMEVLHGARETIMRDKPALLVELEQRHHGKDIRPFLYEIEEMGYAGFFFNELLERCPISNFSTAIHQDESNADKGSLAYCINFLFKPIE